MATRLRVLIVEDRPADAELALHELRRAGFDPEWVRVDTEADYLLNLDRTPQVILADYHLPQFDAHRALDLLRARGLDVPVIVVSGVLGDELAVQLIKQGAADYVLKDRLGRLGHAVKKALEEKRLRDERKQAEEERARLLKERERDVQRLTILREINLASTSTLDLGDVLNIVVKKIALLLPYSSVLVWLLNEDGVLERVACRNVDEEEWRGRKLEALPPLPRAVIESQGPISVRNVLADPRTRDLDFFRRHGLISYLGVPLIAKGKVLGVLSLFTKWEHEFGAEEIEFLSILAREAAIAIHNSQLYEEIKERALELKKANKVKDEFLSVVSHELRTPLTTIMGYTGMVRDRVLGDINPEMAQALNKVLDRARDLLSMIDCILYTTSLESESIRVEAHEVDLRDFLEDLKSNYDLPRDKELALVWDYPSELPAIRTDGGKLRQILENLINNAIKFTAKGTVTISARHRPEVEAVEFRVADTGIGIPKDELPTIYEKFRQIDSSSTRIYGGVGLGLYIVKRFTELLGGRVEAESEPGVGSTFTVTLPLQRPQAPLG